ncbi:MAG TPA: hypothetical protein VGO49_18325 [Bradyrhizobium sp.]|nr:hypothetical protein [Bradyrhizobium sp.]
MAQPQLPLKDASRTVLRDFVDGKAEEFRDVLKIRIKDKTGLTGVAEKIGKVLWSDRKIFDVATGVIAIVEDIDIGPSSRRVLILNNGFRSEGAVPAAKAVPTGVTISPRDFTPLGPFEEIRNGQKIKYLKTDEGVRIEFEKTTITRVVGPDGVEIPISKFKGFEIGPNVHHAEMRALDWAKRNNCRIVAMAPTRGCCAHCLSRLQEYFGKDVDDAIAKHRQTRSGWRSFLKNLPKPTAQLQRTPALTTGGKTEFVARKDAVDLARLRSQSSGLMAKAAAPNPKLVRIARFLKVAGPVMMAFDAATSYAKASDQWNKGQKDAAADTVAEFGGRVAGAFVGAEALGLAFGGVGSVIPGLGTTVGALAGAVIGGAIGAYLGEQEAKQLCHQIMAWAKGSHPEPQAAQSRAAVPPTVSSDPAVEELQSQMYQTGFTRPEIDMIGKIVNEHNRARPWSTVRSPKEIFEQLGAGIIDARSVSEPIAYVASYPFTDVDRAGSAATQIRGHGQSETGHLRTSAHEARPLHGREAHPNEPSHKPGPWGPRPSEPRVTREVTGTVLTPLSGTDQRRNAASGEQDSQIADLSGRVDNLRQRLKDYDGLATGPADFNSVSRLEADLGELRTIREQLLFLDASAIEHHTVSRNLDEVRNRLEDTAEVARKAQDQRDNLAKARADEDRARQLDDLQKRKQDERNETQNDRIRFGQERRAEMQSLQELQDRKLKDAERDRIEDEQSRQARQERQVAEDRRKRDEEERRAPARNGRPPDDIERPRHDQAPAKTENDGRDVRPRDDAPKQQDKEDARRRDDRISPGGEEIGRKREDAVQNRTEGPRKRDDALSKQNDAGARDREDVIRNQKEDDTRRDEATRKQKDDDDRRDHATRKQKEDDTRRDQATGKQKEDDDRRDEAIRKQKEDDDRRDHATRRQKEDDDRRDHAARKQKQDDERRDHAARKQKEDDERRAYAIPKRNEDDDRRDHAARKQKEDDERRDHAARKQKDDHERRDHAARKQKQDDDRRDHAIPKQKDDHERRDHAIPRQKEDDARRREEGKGSEREQHRQGRPQGRDDRYGKAENDRDWKALQDEKDKQRREQEAKAKRHARDDERARKDWDRKRDQETRQRQHHDEQQKRRAERERNEKQRELRERAIEEERQRKKWEWQRQEKDKERRRLEREAQERRRSDERARAQQERDRKQADWERRKLEKQQEQEARRRREYQMIQRTREDERRRKHEERQRQHEQNEHRRQQKQAERDQIKRQKQADWERRKWEKQQEQHARRGDAQRNRSWYSTSVTGRIKKW